MFAKIRIIWYFWQMEFYDSNSVIPQGRRKLSSLVRSAGDVISIDDAARILEINRSIAAKILSRWAMQGWLRRVAHGAYVPVSIDSLGSEHVLDDAWVLVPTLFAPAYVGGRSAAEYWDLTEQIFNDIVVLTTQSVRDKSLKRHGISFSLKHISDEKMFGTKSIWRLHTKVPVSDVHRTIIDMLDDPKIGGGIQQVADCLAAYLRRDDRDDKKLIAYAEQLGNGAVFKRLGFLVENDPANQALATACLSRLTQGNAKLDPALESTRLVSRWKLWTPSFWKVSARL